MATSDSNRSTLAQDVADILGNAYPIKALLTGALSLLEEHVGGDQNGRVWSAKQLIELAVDKTADIYLQGDSLNVIERAKALEGGVNHG